MASANEARRRLRAQESYIRRPIEDDHKAPQGRRCPAVGPTLTGAEHRLRDAAWRPPRAA
jgi:hypothetical protein